MDLTILENTIKNLRRNHFDVFFCENRQQAQSIFLSEILPAIRPESISWGDSETMRATHVVEKLENYPDLTLIRTFGKDLSYHQKIYWRRQALLADLFLTGSNAITQKGQLVNLDMIGNRVGGITFGPKEVVLFVGTNKIVPDLEVAMQKIKNRTAPQNILRHENFNTPCRKTGVCMDCNSSQRICNSWVITEKSYPAGRIKIILINEELGL